MLGLTRRSETQWSQLPPDQLAPLQGLLGRQSERLASVVEQLLLVSSIEDGTLRSARTSTDAGALLRTVARESGLDEDTSTPAADDESSCTVELEPVGVRRILSILVDNARRHGAEPIQLRSRREADHVALDVVDHGPGIDPSFLSTMFERFTRNSTAGKPGVGLGLAIAHELATSLDAHIGYRRDGGQTVFTLRLPRR
jgi:signal transduction histidine kinase